MHGNDRLGARRNGGFSERGVYAIRFRIHIHQHGKRVGKQHGARGGHQREVGNNDFISRLYSGSQEGHLQGGGSIGHSDSMAGTMEDGEGLLESQSPTSRSAT